MYFAEKQPQCPKTPWWYKCYGCSYYTYLIMKFDVPAEAEPIRGLLLLVYQI